MADSIEIDVRVAPGSRRSRLIGRYGDRLKLAVTAPAERGKANRAVLELLAGILGVPVARFEIVRGSGSPDKCVRIHGLGMESIRRLELALDEADPK